MPMFKSVSPYEITGNTFDMIDNQWMLITAGSEEKFNMMTASWGGLGIMWGRPVATCYIRPQRYTKEFVDAGEYLTLTFFGDDQRGMLRMCGSKSGRDCDKVAESGLSPVFDKAAPYYEEAKLVLVCRKLYCQPIDPECFLDPSIAENYAAGDYHLTYICEITEVLVKED